MKGGVYRMLTIGRRVLFPKEQIDRIKSLKATNRKADKNAKG